MFAALRCSGLGQVSQMLGQGWTGSCTAPRRGQLGVRWDGCGSGGWRVSPLSCCGIVELVERYCLDTCLTKTLLASLTGMLCPEAAKDVFNLKLDVIRAVGLLVAVIMIFGMMFSISLLCYLPKQRTTLRATNPRTAAL